VGGAADSRKRDSEFAAREGLTGPELSSILKQTVDEALPIIAGLTQDQLTATVVVQGYNKSVLEVVYHVVEHFSLHAGQIMYITKMLRKVDLGFYRHLQSPTHQERTP
jgi:hypothetical protein